MLTRRLLSLQKSCTSIIRSSISQYSTSSEDVSSIKTKATAVREKFVEFQKTHPHTYLGFDLADEENSNLRFQRLGKHFRHWLDRFYISEQVPAGFSSEAADLYSRLVYAVDYIRGRRWNELTNDLEYEEYLSCNTHYEQVKGKLNPVEAKQIDHALKRLNVYWDLALKVESVMSIVAQLKEKYKNTYTLPKEDLSTVVGAVEEYLALQKQVQSEKVFVEDGEQDKIYRKLERNILMDIVYLKQKLVLPELSLKYPALFK